MRTASHWTISIHALREEGDLHTGHHAGCAIDISIHALREEGDGNFVIRGILSF